MSDYRERLDEERYELMEREDYDAASAMDADMRLLAREESEGRAWHATGFPVRQ